MNVAEGVTGDAVEVNVGVLVGVSLGAGVRDGVIEGIDTLAAVPVGAQALRRRRIRNREIFFIVCLVEHESTASRSSRVNGAAGRLPLASHMTGHPFTLIRVPRRRPALRIAVKPSPALPP